MSGPGDPIKIDHAGLLAEIVELRLRLEEAEETLCAIRSGEVDALVVSSGEGEKIFTLEGADLPYRVLVETMSEGAATLNPDSTILYGNRRLSHLLGVPLEKLLGSPLLAHVAPAHAPLLVELLDRAVASDFQFGEAFRAELSLTTAAGEAVPVLLSCCSLILADSRGISLIVTDLSEHKRNAAIVAASQLEKNAEIERFTCAVSHDLQSPLLTIKTFLGFLKEDMAADDASRIDKDMLYMHAAVDKMQRLLDELLQLSRVGRVANATEPVTFGELVAEALAAVAGGIRRRGVAVAVADVELALRGDRPRLAEIWQNLIDNAVKYMGEQSAPRIDVGVESGGSEPVFYVRDNGGGIEASQQGKVFDLFVRLDSSVPGTGLGLALVKRIVELHGGRIWVESAGHGRGACFRFTLPAALVAGERKKA